MKRREFIKAIVGTVAAGPGGALAQHPNEMRRIGVLTNLPESDPEAQSRNSAFLERMRQLGWSDGANLRIEFRYALGAAERTRKYAEELVALRPAAILAIGTEATAALRQAAATVPIVFVLVPDPVGAGFVSTLAHPGGNITGFTPFEYNIASKWIELLKEIAPDVARVAVLRDSAAPEIGQFATIQAVAPSLHLEVTPLAAHSPAEIAHVIATFAGSPNGGLIVPGSAMASVYHGQIVTFAAQYKLPAVYFQRFFVTAGGLTSYGPDFLEQYRQAAGYINRILRGENPGGLPVQVPTKYQLVINLKTAKALGLKIPPSLLATANEVIE